MGTKTVYVSDLTDQEADPDDLGRLTILDHPEYGEVTLDALPADIDLTELEDQFVTVQWQAAGAARLQRLTVRLQDFNRLAKHRPMDEILEEKAKEQKRARDSQGAIRRGRRSGDGRTRGSAEKIDYGSPEHAGNPHRGRATEAEAEFVRTHLADVNARLKREGLREIDVNDPKMQERFGLSPTAQPAASRSS